MSVDKLIRAALVPPKECVAICLPSRDKRRKSLYTCKLGKLVWNARKRGECRCKKHLEDFVTPSEADPSNHEKGERG